MGEYRVNLNLAPSGGRALAQGEIVSIADDELGPYQTFIDRRWLRAVDPSSLTPVAAAVPDDEVEDDAPIVDDPVDDDVDVAAVEPEVAAE